MNAVQEMVRNAYVMRNEYMDRFLDGRRDLNSECNYPNGEFLEVDWYRGLYAREAIARRVVHLWPEETWQAQPDIYEDEDPENETEFEKAVDQLGVNLLSRGSRYSPKGGSQGGNIIWSYLKRADILSGIGTFGVILLGLNDGNLLETPAPGAPPDGNPNLKKMGGPPDGGDFDYKPGDNDGPQGETGDDNNQEPGQDVSHVGTSPLAGMAVPEAQNPNKPPYLSEQARQQGQKTDEDADWEGQSFGATLGDQPVPPRDDFANPANPNEPTSGDGADVSRGVSPPYPSVPHPSEVTNPSQVGPTVPGPFSDADKQFTAQDQLQKAEQNGPMDSRVDYLSKSIYGDITQEQKLSSTMGTDAQYFGLQFTPSSYHGGNPLSPMQGGGTFPDTETGANPPSNEFAPGNPQKPTLDLLYLRVFDESLVQVTQYEADIRNPRFGQPLMYLITLNDPQQPHTGVGLPLATVRVHWSRVIHVADNRKNSEVFGIPRMLPVINRLLDLRKLYGGSAEGYWKSSSPIISLETNPNLGGDVVVDQTTVKNTMYQIFNSLQRHMVWAGLTAKTLAPQLIDPSPHINMQIEAVCIEMECPVRVFKGSERGELASSQDDSAWNDRLRGRQQSYVTPFVIVPFFDRLIMLGILPTPKQYYIDWPDLDAQTDSQKAQIMLQRTQAYAAYVSGNVESIFQPVDFMTEIDGIEVGKAQDIVQSAKTQQAQEQADTAALAQQQGYQPIPPEGYHDPNASPQLPPGIPGAVPSPAQGGPPKPPMQKPGTPAAAKPPTALPPKPAKPPLGNRHLPIPRVPAPSVTGFVLS